MPPPGPRRYWSRRELAHWLAEHLAGDSPTIVGIDHALSFPLRYFEVLRLAPDWMVFLDDFHRHWPTDAPHTYVDFILNGARGQGGDRMGSPRWVIAEFADFDSAERCYRSPEYQAIIPFRQSCATFEFILVDGVGT